MTGNSDISIVLFAGGASAERPVSKMSSAGIYQALRTLGYTVSVIDPAYGKNQLDDPLQYFEEKDYFPYDRKLYLDALQLEAVTSADLVFIGLHGKWGEDGTLQAALELQQIPYTGSGVLACSVSLDKAVSKILFKDKGVAAPDGFSITRTHLGFDKIIDKINASFAFPVVVKPNDEGSTFGLTVVKEPEALEKAVELSFKYSDITLIEQYIPGRELTVGVLDGIVLPPCEIIPKSGIYDYEAKYTKGMSQYITPADLPHEVTEQLQHETLLAYSSLGCRGYARVDFRMTDDFKHYCLELNPLPGMTATSLLPKMAKAMGISYEEVVDKIVKAAL